MKRITKINSQILSIIFCIQLLISLLIGLIPNNYLLISAESIPSVHDGNWNIINNQQYDGGICILTGNLTIRNGGYLILNNLTIILNSTFLNEFNIIINSGGILKIFNSTIYSLHGNETGGINTNGFLYIEHSTIFNSSGITIYGGQTILKNDQMIKNYLNTILMVAGNISISNSNLSNNNNGIIIIDGNGTLMNNNISNNSCGLDIYGGKISIENSYMANNQNGILIHSGFVSIMNNTIMGSNNYAINLFDGNTSIVNNKIFSNYDGIGLNGGNAQIINNNISNNYEGIILGIDSKNNNIFRIENNTISNNKFGINYFGGSAIIIDNTILQNWFVGLFIGVPQYPSAYPTVNHCIFHDNNIGIYENGIPIKLINVTIKKNQIGLLMENPPLSNTSAFLYNSTLSNNAYDIKIQCGNLKFYCIVEMYNSIYTSVEFIQPFHSTDNISTIKTFWFVDIIAKWQSNNSQVQQGNITILNDLGNIIGNKIMFHAGQSNNLPVLESEKKFSGTYNNLPYIFNISGTRGNITRTNQTLPIVVEKNMPITILLDDVPPVLTIFNPKDGEITNKINIQTMGQSEPGASVWFGYMRISVSPNGNFMTIINLTKEGRNEIRLKAIDNNGNEKYAEVNVTRDTLPPYLTIDTPKDGDFINHTSIEVKGTTEYGTQLKINEMAINIKDDGSFNSLLTMPEGLNTINITSCDAIGNINTKIINFTIDITPPQLNITEPKDNFLTLNDTIYIIGYTEAKSIITINGIPIIYSNVKFQFNLSLKEGTNKIVIIACDRAKNCITRTINGTLDTSPPILVIIQPTNRSTYNKVIEIYGRTELGADVNINGLEIPVDKTGDFHFNITLISGQNIIPVRARDKAGNENHQTIIIIKMEKTKTSGLSNIILTLLLLIIISIIGIYFYLWNRDKRNELKK